MIISRTLRTITIFFIKRDGPADIVVLLEAIISDFWPPAQRAVPRVRDGFKGATAKRRITIARDRHLIIASERNLFVTERHLQQNLQNATGRWISEQTVKNRLREVSTTSWGLFGCSSVPTTTAERLVEYSPVYYPYQPSHNSSNPTMRKQF